MHTAVIMLIAVLTMLREGEVLKPICQKKLNMDQGDWIMVVFHQMMFQPTVLV